MRRTAGASRQRNGSGDATLTSTSRRKRRRIRRSLSRIQLFFLLAGLVVVFLGIVTALISWVSSPYSSGLRGQEDDSIETVDAPVHRDFRPPKFQRYTENAPACDPIEADNVSFTLVTQLSNDRLWMMKHHCDRWGNVSPMSVAILTNRTHEEILDELVQLGCDASQLEVQVVSSDIYPRDEYPVNVLRNLALSVVSTSHVMYADIDFWEAQDLRHLLHLKTIRQALAEDHKRAIVVPAFQLIRQCREWRECPEHNVPRMPRTRHDMAQLVKSKNGFPFDPTNRGGHGSTLYGKWLAVQKEPGSLIDIPCVYSNRYEPYLAFRYCRDLPPFQELFSGYGKNKMTMVMQMLHSGYRLSQLGGGFLVHYPHLDSTSRLEWNESPKDVQPKKMDGKWHQSKPKNVQGVDWTAYKRGRVDATFIEFRTWLAEQVPDESVMPKCPDAEDDDSKLWYDRSEAIE